MPDVHFAIRTDLKSPIAHNPAMRSPSAIEMARTVKRTLDLAEIGAMRAELVAEWPIYTILPGHVDAKPVAGRLDAAVIKNGKIDVVLDWKSDINPSVEDTARHAGQLGDYLSAT